MSEEPRAGNRLAQEPSPYLRQHANNPVDWWPWCDEAFEEARRRNVPVFLSIGYATCHWCHVMAHESFEHAETARRLNETFVCIKVDREERPDVDAVYMDACQMLTGAGGWPLTLVLTPEREPFFAGTYLPRTSRGGRPGLDEFIPRMAQLWREQRKSLLDNAQRIMEALNTPVANASGDSTEPAPSRESALNDAARQLSEQFDEEYAGFGTSVKFPAPHVLLFLLRHHRRMKETGETESAQRSLDMVLRTLRSLRAGGMFDHVGYGFHRYSTDRAWTLPHFEKMLYDQALLVMAYAEAYQATGDAFFRTVAEEVIQYVLRDLAAPEGGFFCAEDADSEGPDGDKTEGAFYVFSLGEVRRLVNGDRARVARHVWSMSPEGNFLEEATRERTGANVLRMDAPLQSSADKLDMAPDKVAELLESARQELFAVREQRPRPQLDDKILADWNGLMIAALAMAGRIFDEPAHVEAAIRAANFVRTSMRDGNGLLLHRHHDGDSGIPGFLNDYAFMAWALVELHQATLDADWLEHALELTDFMVARFWDPDTRVFNFAAHDAEELVARPRETYDAAIPSGNSVALSTLQRLALISGRLDMQARADELAASVAHDVAAAPSGHAHMLCGVDFLLGPARRIVISPACEGCTPESVKAMADAVRRHYRPRTVLLRRDAGTIRLSPHTMWLTARNNAATAYVCRGRACSEPVTTPAGLERLLDG